MLGNSDKKFSLAPSHRVDIAINPPCCSIQFVDFIDYIIKGTNKGNKNLFVKSLIILPKQSSAADDKSLTYRQLSSNVLSQSGLSTVDKHLIIATTVYYLKTSLFLINADDY